MTVKSVLRRLLLFPLWPHIVRWELVMLRALRLLPRRIPGVWPPRRVLIVNPTANLGDTLMMLPTVDALKRALPQVAIDLVIGIPMEGPLRAVPSLRLVFPFEAGKSRIRLLGDYVRIFNMARFARRHLNHQPYDLALLPRWGTDPFLSAYLAAMSTASRRCGHDPDDEAGSVPPLPGMDLLLTAVSRGGQGMAEGIREQLILSACGLVDPLDAATEEHRPVKSVLDMGRAVEIGECMRRLGLAEDRPFILLAPGASHPARRWPAERFSELGDCLGRSTQSRVYTIGAPGDHLLGSLIEKASGGRIRSLVGQTDVLETIAITQRAALLVTNDSGPAHVGGSVGTPTLVLSICPQTSTEEHANSPRRVRPVGPKVRVVQPVISAAPCGERCLASEAHCILGLSVAMVLREAEYLLSLYSEGGGNTPRTGLSTTAGAPAATL